MTVIAVISVKHSPGATTAAVALATAFGPETVVVEADPAGGDIAARARLPVEPGLVTMAAAGRHAGSTVHMAAHCQSLSSGTSVVVAPAEPAQTTRAIQGLGERLIPGLRGAAAVSVVDGGRWDESSIATAALRGADLVLLAVEPSVAGVAHAAERIDSITRRLGARLAVLLSGDRPYTPEEVEEALFVPVVGALPIDPRGVAALYLGAPGAARRSPLARAARSALDRAGELVFPDNEAEVR